MVAVVFVYGNEACWKRTVQHCSGLVGTDHEFSSLIVSVQIPGTAQGYLGLTKLLYYMRSPAGHGCRKLCTEHDERVESASQQTIRLTCVYFHKQEQECIPVGCVRPLQWPPLDVRWSRGLRPGVGGLCPGGVSVRDLHTPSPVDRHQ